ncbi:MAG: DUF2846 domain-containing protein [Myxococcaceae bacterium]
MKRLLVLGWITAGWMAAQGCAHAPPSEPVETERPTGEVRPTAGQSAIVVYRAVSDAKSAALMAVQVDGVAVGQLAREKFAVIDVAPGKHVISARTPFGESGLVVDTEVGVVHFVQLEGSAVPRLSVRDAEVARVEIATDCSFGFRGKADTGQTAEAPRGSHDT